MFSGGYAIFFNERNNLVFLGVNIFKIDERGKTTLLGYYIFDRIKKRQLRGDCVLRDISSRLIFTVFSEYFEMCTMYKKKNESNT